MEAFHIYISGEIGPDSDPLAAEMGIYGKNHLIKSFEKFPNAKKAVIHINSPGGDVSEGFAMYDFLVASGKEIETIVEGRCSSIATIVFLAGTTRKITENSKFFIHNPWTETSGDADAHRKTADALQKTEDVIANFYHEKTGGNIQTIQDAMKVETDFTADEAVALGFATEKVLTVSAKAILKISTMSKPKLSLTQRLHNAIKALQGAKNLDLTLADGTAISVDTAGEDVAVGDGVFVDGNPAADGEYTLQDGKVLVVAGGKVSEIKTAAPPAPANNNPAPAPAPAPAPKADANEAIVKALETITASLNKHGETLANLQSEFSNLKTAQANQQKNTETITEAIELIGTNLHSAGFKGLKKKTTFAKHDTDPVSPEEQRSRAIAAARKRAGLDKEKTKKDDDEGDDE